MRTHLCSIRFLLVIAVQPCEAQKRMMIVDQGSSAPGGSNLMSMMVMLKSPQVENLGITIITGNAWRDEEARHALRMLEMIGRSDVPVALGAVFPLVRTEMSAPTPHPDKRHP